MRFLNMIKLPAGALLLLCFAGCQSAPRHESLHRYEFKQPHMGTLFTITLFAPDESTARQAADAAFEKVAALDRMMSDYDPDSELMQFCRKPAGEPVRLSEELFDVLQRSQQVSELSDGAFDVTIGPLIRQWRRARRTETLPTSEQINRARESVGWRKLKLDLKNKTATLAVHNMQLDLGGIAKGYTADKALEILRQRGISRALVAASGDIAIGDPPPGKRGWRIGVGSPASKPQANQAGSATIEPIKETITLANTAISTSGDEQQFVTIDGMRYSHILDPRTGIGLTNHFQVSVIASRAMDTDAFATTLCVLGKDRGLKLIKSQRGMKAIFQTGEPH